MRTSSRPITSFINEVRGSIRRQNEELGEERSARVELQRQVNELASTVERVATDRSASSLDEQQALADHLRRIERTDGRVDALDASLRKFDEQAARMVTHFSHTAENLVERFDDLESRQDTDGEAQNDVVERLVAVGQRVDGLAASLTQQSNELTSVIARCMDPLEDRVNDRLMSAEVRLRDELVVGRPNSRPTSARSARASTT